MEDASDAALEVKKLGYALYKNPSRPDKGYGELFMNRRSARVDNNESIIECGYSYDDEMDYSFDYFIVHPAMEVMQKPVLLRIWYLLTNGRWT